LSILASEEKKTMPKHLVLVGGGHAHMTLLVRARDFVDRGIRVTLVSASPYQYYSGMGPGLLAGIYRPRDIRFHVQKTITNRGGEFIEDRVVRVDAKARQLHLQSGRVVGYDAASFNTGSEVTPLPRGEGAANVFSVKPINSLIAAQQAILDRIRKGRVEIVVIGGGPAGLELAGNAWRLVRDQGGQSRISLVPGRELLAGYPKRLRDMARGSLLRRGISVRDGSYAERIEKNSVVLANADGETLRADVVLVATGIRPSSLFKDSGLLVGPDNGLLVNRFLQSTACPELFGGGDAISFGPRPLAKVGVYAVRENMVLYQNILATLAGGELVPFEPQHDYMLIFNMGDNKAIVARQNFIWGGWSSWKLKDWIDRSFMKKFQVSGERDDDGRTEEAVHGDS
jgi:NADH dehydrogenase FAD-containing subunit